MSLLGYIGSYCTADAAAPLGAGPLLGLFLAGLAGSVLHCAPMCGPFVLGQVSARMARLPAARMCEWRRAGAGMALPYHAGRLLTYAMLGALAGGIGAGLNPGGAGAHWLGRLPGVLLALAAGLFAAHAARRLFPPLARLLPGLDPTPPGLARGVGALLSRAGGNGFLHGVLLGFLPCGLLYAALVVAAAGQSPAGGVAAMLAFGLGTLPTLLGIGLLGQGLARRFAGTALARLPPAVLVVNALVLAVLAWQRLSA